MGCDSDAYRFVVQASACLEERVHLLRRHEVSREGFEIAAVLALSAEAWKVDDVDTDALKAACAGGKRQVGIVVVRIRDVEVSRAEALLTRPRGQRPFPTRYGLAELRVREMERQRNLAPAPSFVRRGSFVDAVSACSPPLAKGRAWGWGVLSQYVSARQGEGEAVAKGMGGAASMGGLRGVEGGFD